ncbi:MAG: glycosyltransferase [Anaerolineales bacterium]|nr:glycosyltransferase [Anaerolineales bacterium]
MVAPNVSVVMCVYNEEHYIRDAIDSILSQTYDDFELIVVDDASTDGTPEILRSFVDERIIIFRNEKNSGPYRSANKGISLAQGEFIARHDADDISHPKRFEKQVNHLIKNNSIGMVSSDFQYIDKSGHIIDSVSLPASNHTLQERLTRGNIFAQGSVIFRRSVFDQVGGYRDYFPVSQDYDLWLRMSEVSELANIDAPLYQMRFHSKSISRNKRALQLACKQLAWQLASQRREGKQEGPIPTDVLSAFPPEPWKLFLDARGSTYLYFASGEFNLAAESLTRAMELLSQFANDHTEWQAWVLGRAKLLSNLRDNPQEGRKFIEWFFSQFEKPLVEKNSQETVARFYADLAFQNFQKGSSYLVFHNAWRAVRNDPRWLRNRGLWSISMKSMLSSMK